MEENIKSFVSILSVPYNFTGKFYLENDNSVRYYLNGKYHRLDGPAIELEDGRKIWLKQGSYHRLDGPAMEYPNGKKEGYKEGVIHRLDGPAIEFADGSKAWYVEGNRYTEEEFRTSPEVIMHKEGLGIFV
jgi:hypothetical protein